MTTFEYEPLPEKQPTVLHNVTCPYCGVPFTDANPATTEHVVGRRFVPKGCLQGQWNVILNACGRCNGEKAVLEDDISAISMQRDHDGRLAVDDARLAAEADRKGRGSWSRRTGKPVKDSREELKFSNKFGVAEITLNVVAAAQVETQRIWELARFHWRGLFYYTTYDETRGRGGYAHGPFCPVATVRRHDWGNPRMVAFANQVLHWPPLIHGASAEGYFKFSLRQHPGDADVASWAFEWNQNFRVVGFIGELQTIESLRDALPWPEVKLIEDGPRHRTGMRRNIPLAESDDLLFTADFSSDPGGAGP
jgi:hypothetical protein